MNLYFHYCPQGLSNCYILGADPPATDAIIIDPGSMDTDMLRLIEENTYKLKGVFITHDHPHHVQGLKTIIKVYNTKIYAINPIIRELRTTIVHDGEQIKLGPFKIEVISIPGHSADSAVFKVGRFLFSGDSLTAGLVGGTVSSYAAATQVTALRSKILSLPGDYTVLPGHGPPSSLEAERRFNLGLNTFDQLKTRRPAFKFEQ